MSDALYLSWTIDKVASGYVVRAARNEFYLQDRGTAFAETHGFSTMPEALDFIRARLDATPPPEANR